MHVNVYAGSRWPRVQVILWRGWKGLRWHRWRSPVLAGSLLIGWIEVRVWRRGG